MVGVQAALGSRNDPLTGGPTVKSAKRVPYTRDPKSRSKGSLILRDPEFNVLEIPDFEYTYFIRLHHICVRIIFIQMYM